MWLEALFWWVALIKKKKIYIHHSAGAQWSPQFLELNAGDGAFFHNYASLLEVVLVRTLFIDFLNKS